MVMLGLLVLLKLSNSWIVYINYNPVQHLVEDGVLFVFTKMLVVSLLIDL